MSFTPQSIPVWPSKRAVLFVHGIGDASTEGSQTFPIDAFNSVLGDSAEDFAIYTLNYDFINDWLAVKTDLASGVRVLKAAIARSFGGDDLAGTIAEYAGDVLWPILSADLRLAVRDALIAQAAQIMLDAGENMLSRGLDPMDAQVSIIAHSLGCFHTYETLCATVSDPRYHMQPATDLTRLQSVILMASPVQLIRTVGNDIRALVPDVKTLATLSAPLAIPAETLDGQKVSCAREFISVVGNQDPVGGFLRGRKQSFAFMNLKGQEEIIDEQTLIGIDQKAALIAALTSGVEHGVQAGATNAVTAGVSVTNPHSWIAYIERHGELLRRALLT